MALAVLDKSFQYRIDIPSLELTFLRKELSFSFYIESASGIPASIFILIK